MLTVQGLTDHPLFQGLSESQANALLAQAAERTYNGGDVILRQFEKNNDMLIVTSGEVGIRGFSGDMVARLGPGSVVGEISLIDDEPRSATVVAIGLTSAVVLPNAAIRDLMDADAGLKATIMENLAKILCARLRASNL
jgi:CRP-like cAMP-binding protein